jgi:DNA-directed RNA polymerase subunit E'/Rpb7
VPKAAQPSSKPIGVEIQIGFPPTAAVTTSSVITETTTYTQVTTETFQDEEDIPKIVEGDSVHTTIVRVDKEDESKPEL